MASSSLSSDRREALSALATDLRQVFGTRFQTLVAYGLHDDNGEDYIHTLALVERVTFEDLAACAPASDRWNRNGLAVPLVISRDEFVRTLDVFPLEYDGIISDHVVVDGQDPFVGVRVLDTDRRRGIELQAKSHLIHLREGFLESGRDSRAVARLMAASAPAFRRVLAEIARLNGELAASDDEIAAAAERSIGIEASVVREVLASRGGATTIADPSALLARYISAAERMWRYVDAWRTQW